MPEDLIYNEHIRGPFAVRFSESADERLILFATNQQPSGDFAIQSLKLATNGTAVTSTITEATNSLEPYFAITFVPNDPDRAFGITQSGNLFELDLAGSSTAVGQWTMPVNDLYPSHLIPLPGEPLNLLSLSQSGIGRFDDASQTWTTMHVWPDPNERLLSLAVHPTRQATLFLGTSRGVYLSEDGGLTWQSYRLALPRVPVTELTFDGAYLYAATYGRGLWRCRPCPILFRRPIVGSFGF